MQLKPIKHKMHDSCHTLVLLQPLISCLAKIVLNLNFVREQAHYDAPACKPSPNSDILTKFDYVRAKYERKAFHPDGDGKVVRQRRGLQAQSTAVAKHQAGCSHRVNGPFVVACCKTEASMMQMSLG